MGAMDPTTVLMAEAGNGAVVFMAQRAVSLR